ncbi:Protein of unknown function [Zhouia amylolytica]|uniref:DUF2961 domain-containing protein n=1 Tax=Zhouia amylolytica TaxID=376730 RepID=A0A1I6T813_9FLAO|nr:Protein of unknown function [Zhouia amylolytica]
MNNLNIKLLRIIVLALLVVSGCQNKKINQEVIDIYSLLNEMMDRDRLAIWPELPYKTLQVSSYSRKSIAKNQEGWYDNNDASQFVRIDTIQGRQEFVLMDEDGPGAIVRFWSTWHAQKFSMGTLRFYFDHSQVPQIEGRIDQIISANKYVGKELSQPTSPFLENGGWFSGHNLYLPLPYAKHCKVTYQKADEKVDDVLYYQINYRKYDSNISVKTFQKGDWESDKFQEKISKLNEVIYKTPVSENSRHISSNGSIDPNGDSISLHINGNRVIRQLTIKLSSENLEQALRSTVVKMTFDGKQTVCVPVGDFFGTGYKISPTRTWLNVVEENGLLSIFFPMPFKKLGQVSLYNYGNQVVDVEKFELIHSPWKWDDQSLYFHANWRNYSNIKTSEKRDINYVHISGKGKYVGDVLTLFNNSYEWWGEGDEKIYVDDETFPSNFGTGTEDYYGYAWCSVVNFSSSFVAQPIGNGNRSPGLTVNSRWRSLDVIPFNKSLKFDMELWHWDKTQMDYSPTTFWYGTEKATANEIDVIEQEVKIPVKLSQRFEGEGIKVESISGGEIIVEAFLSYEWSARNHMLWRSFNKGDKLDVLVYSGEETQGELKAVFTTGPEYAKVDVILNGQMIFQDLDLNGQKLAPKTFIIPKLKIRKGNNRLRFVIKGMNTNNFKASKFGCDFIEIN